MQSVIVYTNYHIRFSVFLLPKLSRKTKISSNRTLSASYPVLTLDHAPQNLHQFSPNPFTFHICRPARKFHFSNFLFPSEDCFYSFSLFVEFDTTYLQSGKPHPKKKRKCSDNVTKFPPPLRQQVTTWVCEADPSPLVTAWGCGPDPP